MTYEEKDKLLDSFGFETVESGIKYYDTDLELDYVIGVFSLVQVVKWLMDYKYTRGLVDGRTTVQNHIKTALDL